MINKLKELIELVLNLNKFIKYIIVPLIGILIIFSKSAFSLISKNVIINLPIWLCIVIVSLAVYPILKIIELLIHKNTIKSIRLYGLLWKISHNPFKKIIPFCPIIECNTEVICKITPPQSVQRMNPRQQNLGVDFTDHYTYVCPNHGRINGVPDEDITLLSKKALLAFKSEYKKNKSLKKIQK